MSNSSLGEVAQDDGAKITVPKPDPISSLEEAVRDYGTEIDNLERAAFDHKKSDEGHEVAKHVLTVLIARDKVHNAFVEAEKSIDDSSARNRTAVQLIQLDKLDARLKGNAVRYRWSYQVDFWKDSLNKSSDRWWWCSNKLQSISNSLGSLVLIFLGFIVLGIAISLAIHTSSKLLSVNITLLGSSAIVFQSLLLYLASKINLSSSSEWFDKFFTWVRLPTHNKAFAKLCFSSLVLLFVLSVDKGSMWYSQNLIEVTKQNYQNSRHSSIYIKAQSDLEKATKLNPENAEAINLLGQAYEELSALTDNNLDKAIELYTVAHQKENFQGSMNLARVFLLNSLRKEKKEDKIQLLYNSLNIIEGLTYEHLNQSEYSQFDKYLEALKGNYEYNAIKAWIHLELYKIIDGNENKIENMTTAESLIPVAINTLEKLSETEDKPKQLDESHEDFFAIKAFLADHINAYCLRADFLEEALSDEQRIPDIRSIGMTTKVNSRTDDDWRKCYELLDADNNKMFYEIDWFNESELKL